MSCQAPVLVGVSDARGIRQARVDVGGSSHQVMAGTTHKSHPRGFHVVLSEAARPSDQPLSAEVTLELVGTTELAIAPVADDTRMQLDANWPHPSFGGRFLPMTREVRDNGFTATWQVSSLATTAPLDFPRGAALCQNGQVEGKCIGSFNVSFIDPVNPYSLSDRAIKYGLLFIALTFVVQMEQTALVIGSVLLFVVLAGVMTLTRRVDWYSLLRTPATPTVAE